MAEPLPKQPAPIKAQEPRVKSRQLTAAAKVAEKTIDNAVAKKTNRLPRTLPANYPNDVVSPSPKGEFSSPSGLAVNPPGVLIVSAAPEGENQFSTLGAACAAAREGNVVELRYDGPREERPMKISNLRLTIRSGEGYRPVVVFRPTDADPVKSPHGMFTLAGGQLTLTGVAAELHVPRGAPADNWSLLETRGGAHGPARTVFAGRGEHVRPRDDVSPRRGLSPSRLGFGCRHVRRRRFLGHAPWPLWS